MTKSGLFTVIVFHCLSCLFNKKLIMNYNNMWWLLAAPLTQKNNSTLLLLLLYAAATAAAGGGGVKMSNDVRRHVINHLISRSVSPAGYRCVYFTKLLSNISTTWYLTDCMSTRPGPPTPLSITATVVQHFDTTSYNGTVVRSRSSLVGLVGQPFRY